MFIKQAETTFACVHLPVHEMAMLNWLPATALNSPMEKTDLCVKQHIFLNKTNMKKDNILLIYFPKYMW